jgi:hypothetical protein
MSPEQAGWRSLRPEVIGVRMPLLCGLEGCGHATALVRKLLVFFLPLRWAIRGRDLQVIPLLRSPRLNAFRRAGESAHRQGTLVCSPSALAASRRRGPITSAKRAPSALISSGPELVAHHIAGVAGGGKLLAEFVERGPVVVYNGDDVALRLAHRWQWPKQHDRLSVADQ